MISTVKNRRTRFKTIVITTPRFKKIVRLILAIALLLSVWGLVKLFSHAGQQLAFTDSFYKTVISSQMHHEASQISPRKILRTALGFDLADAKSIIAEYSPIFSEEFAPSPTPTPTEPPSDTPAPSDAPAPVGEERPIKEVQIARGMEVSNLSGIEVNPTALSEEKLSFALEDNGSPQILILHTHTTESYTDSDTNKYLTSDSDRNLNEEKNIVAVGNAMTEVFKAAGIATVHDTTVHDYPSFNGAYTRAMATIRANLEANPSIKVVLDVHRDGIVKEDGTKMKVVTEIDGEKTAQCMFVVGSNANLTHNNWLENMKLACKIQRLANEMYPGFMRPINLREERFNQQASTGSLIVEVGSNGNTLDEAIRGGKRMAEIIAKLLKS